MPLRSAFVDANELIFAYAFDNKPPNAPHIAAFAKGENFIRCLDYCTVNNIRVRTTALTYLQLHNKHVWCAMRLTYAQLGIPVAEIFGRYYHFRKLRDDIPLPQAELSTIRQEIGSWLDAWPYREVIELVPLSELGPWLGIAQLILQYEDESVEDCLHLAAAIALESNWFLTEDKDLRTLIYQLNSSAQFKASLADDYGIAPPYGLPKARHARAFLAQHHQPVAQ